MKAGTHTQVPVPMTKDGMKAGAHTQVPVPMTQSSDIRKKKKHYSRVDAFSRCQAKTTLQGYWHEL